MDTKIQINTDCLISLSYVIDEFEDFCNDFRSIVKKNKDINIVIMNIFKLHEGYNIHAGGGVRQFYEKYEEQIRSINNHMPFISFMTYVFESNGVVTSRVKDCHDYLLNHREEVNIILDVLYKIKKLEINEIMLNETYDFDTHVYDLYKSYYNNYAIYCVDNIKVVPSYEESFVRYISLGSDYEIEVVPSHDGECNERTIRLKTLVFDATRMPSSLDKETIYDSIINQAALTEDECVAIRNYVDYNCSVDDANDKYEELLSVVKKIPDIYDNVELASALRKIKDGLESLYSISSQYESSIIEYNEDINKELLDNEKEAFLIRKKDK